MKFDSKVQRRQALPRLLAVALSSALLTGAASADPIPNPTVVGPIAAPVLPHDPSRNYPFYATDKPINKKGYVEEEYFFEGVAKRYDTPAGQTGTVISAGNAYRTRMLVRKPINDKKFNGAVIVEWLNVTAGGNDDNDWFASHEHIMDAGYAYVGVSVQRVGVDYLKTWSPGRYSALDVTKGGAVVDDSLSYDIYSQAGKALSDPKGVDPLKGLRKQRIMLADGESQSAGRLAIYINSIMSRGDKAYDAVVLHSTTTVIRPDSNTKVMLLNSEYDATGVTADRVQPDSKVLRVWEVAGTSHYDWDFQSSRLTLQMRDQGVSAAQVAQCTVPQQFTRTHFRYVLNKAYDHVLEWVRNRTLPPIAPRLTVAGYGTSPFGRPVILARDSFGIAQGGIRLPDVAVPTALNHGENTLASGTGNCALYGHWIPFSAETLDQLYRNNSVYVGKVVDNVRENIRHGYINKDDGRRLVTDAEESEIGDGEKRDHSYPDLSHDPDFN
jgi:Alpha/beta hydrolase domain